MSIKETPEYVPRTYLSVSTLVRFKRCPRLYFYEKSGLRSSGINLAPEWGTGMHFAVPVALETHDIDLSMAAFLSHWEEIEEAALTRGMELKKHTRETASRALSHFIHKHSANRCLLYDKLDPVQESFDLEVTEKYSEFEIPFVLDIGLDVPLGGRMDGMVKHKVTGEPWVWELKTTGRLYESFWDAHEMYTQNLTYTMVGQTMDIPVAGVILEAMLCDGKKVHSECREIPVMQHHLDDNLIWLQQTGQALLDAEKKYLDDNESLPTSFPKDFTGCTPYTHYYMPMWRCNFADLCRVPDYRGMTDLYELVPDHKLFDLTIGETDAPTKLDQKIDECLTAPAPEFVENPADNADVHELPKDENVTPTAPTTE